jgi:hypothetical protein
MADDPTASEQAASTGHAITPLKGSARRIRDGQLADLTRLADYPVEAVCLECGQPIRCERWLIIGARPAGGWVHVESFSLSGG